MSHPNRLTSRRWFLASLACAPAALAIAGRGQARAQETAALDAGAAPSCPAEDHGTTRESFNYIDLSPHGAAKDCRNCEFWIPQEAGSACGGCTLISGPISPLGYCDIWALAGQMVAEGGVAGPASSASQN